jgi:cysteinyl-tRNA synthetase
LEEAEALLVKWRRRVDGEMHGDLQTSFVEALADDLDLSHYLKLLNAPGLSASALFAAAALIGIDLSPLQAEIDVAQFVKDRLQHIANKNWSEADRIRDNLLAQGIQLKDGKDPATGERVTTWEVKR